jgi:hypothetical protein
MGVETRDCYAVSGFEVVTRAIEEPVSGSLADVEGFCLEEVVVRHWGHEAGDEVGPLIVVGDLWSRI